MTLHIGRDWRGHVTEDECPCPQEPCGLINSSKTLESCDQHALRWNRTIRQGHDHTKCPGGEV